jgi:hypothetical protein
MPTTKQKRVAELIVENTKLDEPLNGGEIVENSGYGVSMKKNPQVVLESEGVKEALEEMGFTEANAKSVVTEIMLNPDADNSSRLKATDQVFKVKGSYAPDRNINLNMTIKSIDPTDETILNSLKAIQDKLENE